MKKIFLILSVTTLLTGLTVSSCSSPAEKVEDAQNDVAKANEDLDKANSEYLQDYEKYKLETSERIAANEESVKEFKLRIAHEKKEAREEYNKKIDALEQKNSDMKKKMDDYKADGKDKWQNFKTEFSHDMDELGQAFKDLTVKNVK